MATTTTADELNQNERTRAMPAKTQRRHFQPSWLGDGYAGIRVTARDPLGADNLRCVDINLQVAWNRRGASWLPALRRFGLEVFAMHWGKPGPDNYPLILRTRGRNKGRIVPMTKAELDRPIEKWKAADVRRWRRKTQTGYVAPVSYRQIAAYAVRLDVTVIGEAKSSAFRYPVVAAYLVKCALDVGHRPWFMALYNKPGGKSMGWCREKCAALVGQGASFAVIFGTFQDYRQSFWGEVKRWPVRPTRTW